MKNLKKMISIKFKTMVAFEVGVSCVWDRVRGGDFGATGHVLFLYLIISH